MYIFSGAKIKEWRKKKGKTQEELERGAELSPGHIGKIERGDRKNPQVDVVTKIANTLGIHPGQFWDKESG